MISIHFVLWFVPLFLCIYGGIRFVKFLRHRHILKPVPCPSGHWLLGTLGNVMGMGPVEIFQELRVMADQGWPIYRFDAIYLTAINLLHPCDIEIVLSNMKHLSKSALYGLLGNWLGEGLLTSTGKKWHTRRKILTPAFHFNILQKFLQVFNEETEKLVTQLEENCDQPYIDVIPFVTQMTLQSISETAMGLDNIDESTQQKYKKSIYRIGEILLYKLTRPLYRSSLIYYFTQLRNEETEITEFLHKFSYNVITSREKRLLDVYDTKDYQENVSYSGRKIAKMLDLLLLAKIDGSDIDLEGIREEVDTFLFEGHDTTSMAITFLLLELANNPGVQEKVCQEIEEVLSSRTPTYKDLQELKYTEMVIKESLRLYPSVPFISRVASEEFTTFTGYRIPKDTILHIHIFDLHRDPRIYPDPLKFDPDRFLPENCQNRHPFAYIPFSAGPRNCIGQKFAILELKSVLCGILRKFSLHQVDKPCDLQFLCDLVLRPKSGIRIKFAIK